MALRWALVRLSKEATFENESFAIVDTTLVYTSNGYLA